MGTTGDHPRTYLQASGYNGRGETMSNERDNPNTREELPSCP